MEGIKRVIMYETETGTWIKQGACLGWNNGRRGGGLVSAALRFVMEVLVTIMWAMGDSRWGTFSSVDANE